MGKMLSLMSIAVTDDGDNSDNDNKIPTTRETDAEISQFSFKENETQIIALREEEKKLLPEASPDNDVTEKIGLVKCKTKKS